MVAHFKNAPSHLYPNHFLARVTLTMMDTRVKEVYMLLPGYVPLDKLKIAMISYLAPRFGRRFPSHIDRFAFYDQHYFLLDQQSTLDKYTLAIVLNTLGQPQVENKDTPPPEPGIDEEFRHNTELRLVLMPPFAHFEIPQNDLDHRYVGLPPHRTELYIGNGLGPSANTQPNDLRAEYIFQTPEPGFVAERQAKLRKNASDEYVFSDWDDVSHFSRIDGEALPNNSESEPRSLQDGVRIDLGGMTAKWIRYRCCPFYDL